MTTRLFAIIVSMLAVSVASGQTAEEKRPEPPPIRAEDWVSAWKMAQESCPEATTLGLSFVDRSGPTLRDTRIFDCVDIKAAGQLLVITVKGNKEAGDSVKIVRGSDMVRIEIARGEAN